MLLFKDNNDLSKILTKFLSKTDTLHNMGKCARNNRNNIVSQSGFSLIEAAIALLILGLILTPMIMIYNADRADRIRQETTGNLGQVIDAVNEYVTTNGRYPVPANLFSAPGDADYGIEFSSASIAGCASWPTPDGVCRTPGTTGQILIGAVPFAVLGLNPDDAHDSWGHKLLYAVTEAQTVSYSTGNGNITLQGFDPGRTLADLDSTRNPNQMVVISHGKTAAGAYSQEGVLVRNCFDAGTPRVDEENCDMDGTFIAYENFGEPMPGGDPTSSTSLADNGSFYDDYTNQQTSVPADLWLQNTTDNSYALTFASAIGIGTENPQAKVHVIGDVRSVDLMTDQVCNGAGGNCFNPEIIAGSVPDMDCASGSLLNQAVIDIENSRVRCGSTVDSGGAAVDGEPFVLPAGFTRGVQCNLGGDLMTGFTAGTPDCATPP